MTIYVDALIHKPSQGTWKIPHWDQGRDDHKQFGQTRCQLVSDSSVEELFLFARSIGLVDEWFQDKLRYPHFDLSPRMRARALKNSASEIRSWQAWLALLNDKLIKVGDAWFQSNKHPPLRTSHQGVRQRAAIETWVKEGELGLFEG